MSFGTRLKMLRIKYKLGQESMSKRLNVSQPVYSRYENDEKKIAENDPFVIRVAEEFKISREWLVAEDDDDFIVGKHDPVNYNNQGSGNNYILPGEFFDILLKQHELNEQILRLLKKK